MNTRPIRFNTAISPPSGVRKQPHPAPGAPGGKLAGRSRRGSRAREAAISRLRQMWLPDVPTSTPASNNSRQLSGSTPAPPEMFSQLAMTKFAALRWMSFGNSARTARRPGLPTMSPRKSRFMPEGSKGPRVQGSERARALHARTLGPSDPWTLSGELRGPNLPDDRHLDLSRIGHLALDLAR